MSVFQLEIPVEDLIVGMYVSKLDRPWLETPFKLQGLKVNSQSDIELLQSLCRTVFIDVTRGLEPQRITHVSYTGSGAGTKKVALAKFPFTHLDIRHNAYQESVAFQQEWSSASLLHENLERSIELLAQQVSHGRHFDQKNIKYMASEVVNSVIRNPDVMAWLIRVRTADDYLHNHSIRCAVWAALLGRYIGLRRLDLELLTQAMLLKDIGKTRLPDDLLSRDIQQLNLSERTIYRKHVAISVQLLKQASGINPKILPIIAAHREHYDGTGYPLKLKGDEISKLAIVAGLATYYDELTNPRVLENSLSPSVAVTHLYEQRNRAFQEDIVIEFIQALGIYPAGSIVELNTGELAVIVEQFAEQRLRPKIVIITDKNQLPITKLRNLDLLHEAATEKESPAGRKSNLPVVYIVRDLPQHECSVDLLKVKQSLFNVNKKRLGFLNFLKIEF